MTQDGTWTYTYDGENRLRTMSRSGQSLNFTYDYAGRRVRKEVTGADAKDRKFVWNGWKLAAETTGDGYSIYYSFIWGPDFSNAQGAAGGAGGLLAIYSPGFAVNYAVPDSLGNVVGYLDGNGKVSARYEYTAYGMIKQQEVSELPIGYSGQYTDRETGLVYYGLRYYNPKHGRFINRDPIGESGGNNLFAFVGNEPANGWDVLGMFTDPGVPNFPTISSLGSMSERGTSSWHDNPWTTNPFFWRPHPLHLISFPYLYNDYRDPTFISGTLSAPMGPNDGHTRKSDRFDPTRVGGTQRGVWNAANSDASALPAAAPLRRLTVIIVDSDDTGNVAMGFAPGSRMLEGAEATAAGDPNVIIVYAREDYVAKLKAMGVRDGEVARVIVVDHGLLSAEEYSAVQSVGGAETRASQELGISKMPTNGLVGMKGMLAEDADIVLAGCYVGTNQDYLDMVSESLDGRTVYGPTDAYPYDNPTITKTVNRVKITTPLPIPPLPTPESHPDLFIRSRP